MSTQLFLLDGNVPAGYALTPSQAVMGSFVAATRGNVHAAGGFVVAVVVESGVESGYDRQSVVGVTAGAMPTAFFGAGAASGLVLSSSGQVVRGKQGRNCGAVDANGNGIFIAPLIETGSVRRYIHGADRGMIPDDTSDAARKNNRQVVQSLIDDSNLGSAEQNGLIEGIIPGGIFYFDTGILDVATGIKAALTFRRRSVLRGEALGTILRFPSGCVAIRAQVNNVGDVKGTSDHALLADMRLESVSPSPALNDRVDSGGAFQNRNDHGVVISSGFFRCENVHVNNFGGTGFLIDAPNVGTDSQNANAFGLRDCTSGQNGGKGFWVRDGNNNNASLFDNCSAEFNAQGDWAEQSFFGNTLVACASQGDGPAKIYIGDPAGSPAFDTVVGLYSEGPELPFVNQPAVMLGGTAARMALRNPYNQGLIISGEGCRNLRSRLFKHKTAPYAENETVSVGTRRRPSTIGTLATVGPANGREYICISITTGVCGPEPSEYVATVSGGDPDPGGLNSVPGLVGATFTSGGATWQEAGPIRFEEEAVAFVDYPSGETGFFFGLAKTSEDISDNDILGWFPGVHISGVGAGWWAKSYSLDSGQIIAMAISTTANAESHAHTGRGVC